MDILTKGNLIIEVEPSISFGMFDGEEKWLVKDGKSEDSNILYYILDDDFTLFEDVTLPDDFERGNKYFFENGEFISNEQWKPYISPEQRLEKVEEENARLNEAINNIWNDIATSIESGVNEV